MPTLAFFVAHVWHISYPSEMCYSRRMATVIITFRTPDLSQKQIENEVRSVVDAVRYSKNGDPRRLVAGPVDAQIKYEEGEQDGEGE